MGNEFAERPEHSAEYFGDTRDYWWNADYLELLGRRWRLAEVQTALDVGCGIGHWGQLLVRLLSSHATVTGVDREPRWLEEAAARARRRGLSERFRYLQGEAARLPFVSNSFDLVTCQTVLIHVPDRAAALAEMVRVTKPGGLIAVAEPNNLSSVLTPDAHSLDAPIEELLALARLQVLCERGKAALGLGNNSSGELLPGLFASVGLQDVSVFLNDKTSTMIPPYASSDQRALADELAELARRQIGSWPRPETLRYFLAGGGREDEFEPLWACSVGLRRDAAARIAARTFHSAGGSICYCISGRKPAAIAG
jgi:SAM-dependent methyltransferase